MIHPAKYVYTFEDYLAMIRGVRSKSAWAQWAFLGAAPVFLAIAVFDSAINGTSLYRQLALFSSALLAIGFASRLPIVMRVGFKRCSLSGKTVAYQLSDDGISLTVDERSGTHPCRRSLPPRLTRVRLSSLSANTPGLCCPLELSHPNGRLSLRWIFSGARSTKEAV
jgi:hypothetical protein